MSADNSKYFITCENTNEVRVFDAQTDQLLKVIPTGRMPQEMAQSRTQPYLFVTCLNDTVATGNVGSVYAINYNTYETKRIESKMFQPHGIAVDDRNGVFYVFSRNQDKSGPQPHHISPCNGRNGYYNIFSTSTLLPYNKKRYEISVDPYAADVRFK
jgi:DNA-binding beta-propeller fold protein YncE